MASNVACQSIMMVSDMVMVLEVGMETIEKTYCPSKKELDTSKLSLYPIFAVKFNPVQEK
jgi:hypothetical protein